MIYTTIQPTDTECLISEAMVSRKKRFMLFCTHPCKTDNTLLMHSVQNGR